LFTKVQLINLWEKLHNWTEEIFSGVEGNEVELISDEQKNLLNAVVDTGFLFAEVLDLTSIPEGLVQCVTFLNSKLLCKVLTVSCPFLNLYTGLWRLEGKLGG